MSETRRPHIGYCPNCLGTKIELQIWGRTEFYVCKDCIVEVPMQTEESYEWKQYGDFIWYGPSSTKETK